jgi:GAF domain-containing protein
MNEPIEPRTSRQLANTLGDLAVEMQSLKNSDAVLRAIVEAAVPIVPGASWAGVSLVHKRRVDAAAATDDVVTRLDALQTSLQEGPTLSALEDRRPLLVNNLAVAERWPQFVPSAMDFGVHAMLTFPLLVQRGPLGALTLYGASPHVFSDDSVSIGEILAQHAAVALAGSTAEEQLHLAVESRDVIGQAKGILMHRDRLTGLQAFTTLTKASQETNVRLVDVARWLVDEHEKGLAGAT